MRRQNLNKFGVYVITIMTKEKFYCYIGSGIKRGLKGSELAKRLYQFKNRIKTNSKIDKVFKEEEIIKIYGSWICETEEKDTSILLENYFIINSFRYNKENVLNVNDAFGHRLTSISRYEPDKSYID